MKSRVYLRVGLTALLFMLASFQLFAQSRGAILDPDLYNRLPQKAIQVSRAYTELPATVSLKQYTPYPGNQGQYGTCVAWSTAYAARTIAESIALKRRDRFLTTTNVFSPTFIYKSVADDPTGQAGTAISWALDFMRNEGAVKMLDFERSTDFLSILLSAFTKSRRYPIADYTTLYAWHNTVSGPDRVRAVKKSLAEGKPVIIGMNCPDSFFTVKDVWRPTESPRTNYGGHAMCVIGYDDTKQGGVFEIQNSWGERWGNAGYIWIPYDVFGSFVNEAYEIIENLAAYQEVIEYAGFAEIERYGSDTGMPVVFQDGYYRTIDSYPSGTEFRYLLGNDKPAYVYAFAADEATTSTTRIFPPEGSNVSPVLDYAENVVAFPGEYSWIQLDNRPGTDYLVVLYSKQALDIDGVRARFAQERGSFPERVAKAVGSDFISYYQGNYEQDALRFSATSTNSKAVFGLLLAIAHR